MGVERRSEKIINEITKRYSALSWGKLYGCYLWQIVVLALLHKMCNIFTLMAISSKSMYAGDLDHMLFWICHSWYPFTLFYTTFIWSLADHVIKTSYRILCPFLSDHEQNRSSNLQKRFWQCRVINEHSY